MAYAELEPFGAAHETKLIGMVCATIANFSQIEGKDERTGKRKYWLPREFIPDPLNPIKAEEKKPQTVEEMKLQLQSIATAVNRVNKKPRRKK